VRRLRRLAKRPPGEVQKRIHASLDGEHLARPLREGGPAFDDVRLEDVVHARQERLEEVLPARGANLAKQRGRARAKGVADARDDA
jgi:hypothetical protein